MQNGPAISELLQKLRSIDPQWDNLVFAKEPVDNVEIEKKFRLLLKALRQELKTGEEQEVRDYLLEEDVSRENTEKLVESVKKTLHLYTEFAVLREWEAKNRIELKGLLDIIYQKYIVRYESGYLEQLKNEVLNGEKLKSLAEMMDYLTDYYISRSYTRKKIVQDLQDETGLMEETCEYWADLIEQDYMALKMNYIITGIEKIQMSLRKTQTESV